MDPKIARALEYIEYAADAYTVCYSAANFKKGIMNLFGDQFKPYNNVNEWLREKNYVPIINLKAPPDGEDPINKFYGVCAFKNGRIIVAFRGTVFFGFRDSLTGVNVDEFTQYLTNSYSDDKYDTHSLMPGCETRQYKEYTCKVNTVFTSILEGIKATYKKFISDKLSSVNPSSVSVVFCGHSLGGALAQLAAAEFLNENPTIRTELVTYGSPMVGDLQFSNFLSNYFLQSSSFIVNKFDIVPTLYSKGLDPLWVEWYMMNQYYTVTPPPLPKEVIFVAPPDTRTLNNNSPVCVELKDWSMFSGSYCHPLQYYLQGLQAIDNGDPWEWSSPMAISDGSSTVQPGGDYAATNYYYDGIEYLVVAYPKDSVLNLAVYNGSTWTYKVTNISLVNSPGVQLCSFFGRIYVSVVWNDHNAHLYELMIDGTVLSDVQISVQFNMTFSFAPNIFASAGKLRFLFKPSQTNDLMTCSLHYEIDEHNTRERYFTTPGKLNSGGESQEAPAVCGLFGTAGYTVYRGEWRNNLYYGYIDYIKPDGTEYEWNQFETEYASKEPPGVAILYTGNKIFAICCYKTNTTGSSDMFYWTHDLTDKDQSPEQFKIENILSGTNNPVAVTNYRNKVYLFFCDKENHNYLSYSTLLLKNPTDEEQ